ncbi:MAG: hypothetical protein Q8O92_00675 [Candidatus Latescibacter sp.]|nr:hypothetical protein [Candidatus Latescibacter sp.]
MNKAAGKRSGKTPPGGGPGSLIAHFSTSHAMTAIRFFGDIDDLDVIVEQLGSPEGIILVSWETEKTEVEILDSLRKYGAG